MGLTLAKVNIVGPAILDSANITEFKDKKPTNFSLVEFLENKRNPSQSC